jgi:predicted metal-dependent phosphoesterase TrpH
MSRPTRDLPIDRGAEPLRRCDLHLHTRYSAWKRLKIIRARDSYSEPVEVFDRARVAGMDFVAITDHESIEGALRLLDARPGNAAEIIIGEEVETHFPDTGQWIHINVFGLDEATHAEVQRLRPNVYDLVTCLRERGLLHVLNHPFQSYRFQKPPRAYVEEILALFDHFEVGNGTMPRNHAAAGEAMLRFAAALLQRKTAVAGSDAHVPEQAGSSFTTAPGRTAREWLASVARGECSITTSPIGFAGLLRNIYRAVGNYYGEALTPRGRDGMTAAGYLAAAGLLPAAVLGIPAALALANDVRQRCVARWTRLGLEHATADVSRAASSVASPIPPDRPEILEVID